MQIRRLQKIFTSLLVGKAQALILLMKILICVLRLRVQVRVNIFKTYNFLFGFNAFKRPPDVSSRLNRAALNLIVILH